ncbi:MAG TPA: shikimate kinase [Stellaceae bacterium]|jgi:hypothetical protein|nr:shikimate kinase [Stellaceae bacterium]
MQLVFLYGPAAAGKLAVAEELVALTGYALFHNHLIVDAVASVFPFGSEHFIRLREQFWMTMFREAAEARRSMIFTFMPEASVDSAFPDRVRDQICGLGGELRFVRLTLRPEEQERRIGNAGRAKFGKLRSLDLLRQLRGQFDRCEAAMPEPEFTIDTTCISPANAAHAIAVGLGLPAQPTRRE